MEIGCLGRDSQKKYTWWRGIDSLTSSDAREYEMHSVTAENQI